MAEGVQKTSGFNSTGQSIVHGRFHVRCQVDHVGVLGAGCTTCGRAGGGSARWNWVGGGGRAFGVGAVGTTVLRIFFGSGLTVLQPGFAGPAGITGPDSKMGSGSEGGSSGGGIDWDQ